MSRKNAVKLAAGIITACALFDYVKEEIRVAKAKDVSAK